MNSIIVCEGQTDGILISYGLEKLSGWSFVKGKEVREKQNLAFAEFEMNWYKRDGDYLGIIIAGGNDFRKITSQISERNTYQFAISKLIVVTDHDDIDAEADRFKDVIASIANFDEDKIKTFSIGRWNEYSFRDKLGNEGMFEFYYLLIPEQNFGAMETFVAEEISNIGIDEQYAAEQVNDFVENKFESAKFLTKRRERIKAKLSVLLSVISPDRTFTTINEYLKSVDWNEFEGYKNTFKVVTEL